MSSKIDRKQKTENRKPLRSAESHGSLWLRPQLRPGDPVCPEQGRGRGYPGPHQRSAGQPRHALGLPPAGGAGRVQLGGRRLGAGVILALRLKLALGQALQEFVHAGRLVIGICNGFQVLVNLGLLPNLPGPGRRRLAALIPNDCGNFRDAG